MISEDINKSPVIVFCSLTFDVDSHGPAKFIKLIHQKWISDYGDLIIISPDINQETKVLKMIPNHLPKKFGFLWEYFFSFRMYKKILELKNSGSSIKGVIFVDAKLALFSLLLIKNIKSICFLNDYENITFEKYADGSIRSKLLSIKSRLIEKAGLFLCNKIIVNSNYLGQLLKQKFEFTRDKQSVLYKAIEFENLPLKTNLSIDSNKSIKILFAKNDFIRGGIVELIFALAICTEYQFELIIVGPYGSEWDSFLSKTSIPDNTKLVSLGSISNNKVYELMFTSDIFCVPALRESLGIANIEAMAIGVPVVSTKEGGILETTDNGKNAWLAERKNPVDLAFQLKLCIENLDARKIKVENGKKFVKEKFNAEKMMSQIRVIFDEEFQ